MGRYGKDDERFAGIYKITNSKNGKVYIGQSRNIYDRRQEHFSALYGNRHENKQMQEDWNKTGGVGFRWNVVEYCSIDKLNEREKYWIDKLNSIESGYNMGWVPYKRKKHKTKNIGYHRSR